MGSLIIKRAVALLAMLAVSGSALAAPSYEPVSRQERQWMGGQLPYSGKHITLNFQDIEVRAVLAIIADFTGLNLVASDSVQGRVTLNLVDVPWDQALDLILKSHGLSSRREGNVIVVMPAAELAQREQLEIQSREYLETLAPLKSEYIQLNYAKAEDVAALVRGGEEGFGLLSERGRVAVDQRTNALLIQDTTEQIATLMDTLERLDIAVRQVQIEARIVIASNTAARELGVNWGVSGSGSRFDLGGASDGSPVSGVGGLAVDFGPIERGAGGMTSFAFGYLSGDVLLDLELRAMESDGKSYTISQPRVITANQSTAMIKQGQERAYREAAASGASAVDFKEAVLSLEVTPQITPDNRIIMDVAITNDTFGEFNPGEEPPINKSEIETQVLVDNGQTVVLGGILQTEELKNLVKTPFLGDLPVLGNLFRYTQESNDKVELLVFITPRILDDGVALR